MFSVDFKNPARRRFRHFEPGFFYRLFGIALRTNEYELDAMRTFVAVFNLFIALGLHAV